MNGTIGQGTIELGDAEALVGVNRDVTQVRETVSETDGGSFDTNLTVDHRVFSQTGRSEMGNELKELPGNAVKASRNGYKDTVNAGKAVVDTVFHGGDSREDVVTRYQGYRRNLHVASEIDELSIDQGCLQQDKKGGYKPEIGGSRLRISNGY